MKENVNSNYLSSLSDEILALDYKESKQAVSILISRYINLVHKISFVKKTPFVEVEDLFQEGLIGLFNAIVTYKKDTGAKFSTYANVCISNRITTALIKSNHLDVFDDLAKDDLKNDFDVTNPENIVIQREKLQEIYRVIVHLLSEKEWQIFRLFLTGSTYDQMARQLNVSNKVINNAMQRVRRKLKSIWRAEN